ncbi:cation transporter [Frondihabitans sucicola]|uniref:Cation transporter n=1 Tax=Frondihabitans sucicola TaxID=1268041 RepID=A0ABN6Y4K3_9MICO|nr:cation diffusion facilitator family transporter [Frondihabitans sucicola]BDZ52014.1 cation transporter [Frondihabitans sucicola]
MSHDHAGPSSSTARLGIALGITSLILVAEIVGAVVTDSLSLLVDAGHMLTDVGGLTAALVAAWLIRRPATSSRTWGYRRAEVLAALGQATVLLAVGIYAFVEGIQRLFAPPSVPSGSLLVFGLIGLVGNVVSIAVLSASRDHNLNLRAAFLEVVNDALGSVAVIVGALVISATGWLQADAVAGMVISVLIVPRTIALLRETTGVLLESTPKGLDLDAVRTHMLELPHVRSIHDLHASQIATGLPIISAHVVIEQGCFEDGHAPRILDDLQNCVLEHFAVQIEHSTFQLEPETHQQHEHVEHV